MRAAENGIVAYAGSELKGYGNLVLIRHPNGFVSAYANNGELDVKRGDTVKRGQVIAKSGQSGNVNSPATALRTAQGLDAGRSHRLSRRSLTARFRSVQSSSLDAAVAVRVLTTTQSAATELTGGGSKERPAPVLLFSPLAARAADRAFARA